MTLKEMTARRDDAQGQLDALCGECPDVGAELTAEIAKLAARIEGATEAAAMRAGYTRPVFLELGMSSFAALIEPDADLDDTFRAFDTDNSEWLDVNGWLLDNVEELEV